MEGINKIGLRRGHSLPHIPQPALPPPTIENLVIWTC